jgi:hypothetical protein
MPEGCIWSWLDLCEKFVYAFQGGYKCPGTMNDLHALVQKPEETLRHYMQWIGLISHNILEAQEASIITAFSANVRDTKMRETLSTHRIHTINKLYVLVDKCARAEEGRLAQERAKRSEEEPDPYGQTKKTPKRGLR